jgi:hypothetical protein
MNKYLKLSVLAILLINYNSMMTVVVSQGQTSIERDMPSIQSSFTKMKEALEGKILMFSSIINATQLHVDGKKLFSNQSIALDDYTIYGLKFDDNNKSDAEIKRQIKQKLDSLSFDVDVLQQVVQIPNLKMEHNLLKDAEGNIICIMQNNLFGKITDKGLEYKFKLNLKAWAPSWDALHTKRTIVNNVDGLSINSNTQETILNPNLQDCDSNIRYDTNTGKISLYMQEKDFTSRSISVQDFYTMTKDKEIFSDTSGNMRLIIPSIFNNKDDHSAEPKKIGEVSSNNHKKANIDEWSIESKMAIGAVAGVPLLSIGIPFYLYKNYKKLDKTQSAKPLQKFSESH